MPKKFKAACNKGKKKITLHITFYEYIYSLSRLLKIYPFNPTPPLLLHLLKNGKLKMR